MDDAPVDKAEVRREAVIALVRWLRARGFYGGYRYTQPRDSKRNTEQVKRDLALAWLTHRRQELGADISKIVSFRRGNVVDLQSRRQA